MSKKRKGRRVAKARGRLVTTTTTTRVVKRMRTNPRGVDLSPYRKEFKFGRYKESVDTSHSTKNIRKMMRSLFPDMSKAAHVDRAVRLSHALHHAMKLWGRVADKASRETFGRPFSGFDYRISAVARDEYPERLKRRLRISARQETTIKRAIHAHETMAGIVAMRRAGYTHGLMSNPRPSKTHIEYVIQGNYGYGWDDENYEETRADAKRSLREYRENGPGQYRLIRRRVKSDATNPKGRPSFEDAKRWYVHRFTMEHVPLWTLKKNTDGSYYAPQYRSDREWYENTLFPGEPGGPPARAKYCESRKPSWPLGKKLDAPFKRWNPGRDPRTAETQRMPAVIRASIPAGDGNKDARRAETRRLKVITSSHRKNPVRNLVVPRSMWKALGKKDKRSRHGHRYVRCKTRRSRRAFWLPCIIR